MYSSSSPPPLPQIAPKREKQLVSMAEWAAYYAKDPDAREDKISMVVLDVSDVPAVVERVTAPRVVSEIDWANLMAPLPGQDAHGGTGYDGGTSRVGRGAAPSGGSAGA